MHKKEDAFLVDVDGTIADHTGLRGHYEYEKVSGDRPIRTHIEIVKQLALAWQPVFVTGRMDTGNVRLETAKWIRDNVFPFDLITYPLYMRPATLLNGKPDYRKDYIVKEELYRRYVEPRFNIKFAVDDRLQVCQMWHKLNIPVMRVGDPDAVF